MGFRRTSSLTAVPSLSPGCGEPSVTDWGGRPQPLLQVPSPDQRAEGTPEPRNREVPPPTMFCLSLGGPEP
jgi:hypothetical protein